MKPHVAERAVACLNALTPAQRCDPNRLELCGHTALMSACSIVEPAPDGAGAPSDRPGSGAGAPSDSGAAADEIGTECTAILKECEGVKPGTTMHDCRTTIAGMSVLGRDRMRACMKTHCNDKGLLFCEAQIDVK
jgi:hypothetical protein